MLKPYKNRYVELGQQVEVYRNLHNGLFSLRDIKSKLVIAHGDNFTIKNAIVKFQPSGQKKAKESGVRNVHAYIVGELVKTDTIALQNEITYNPFADDNFTFKATGKDFVGAELMYFNRGKCYTAVELKNVTSKAVKK